MLLRRTKTAEQENPGGQAMCGRYYINDETAKEIEKLIRQINDSLLLAVRKGCISFRKGAR